MEALWLAHILLGFGAGVLVGYLLARAGDFER